MNYNPITLDIPRLTDGAVVAANVQLSLILPWLDNAFGIAQKIPGEAGISPNVPIQSGSTKEYLQTFPNTQLGNFIFWDLNDGQTVRMEGDNVRVTFEAGLVVWGDLRKVYPDDWQTRSIANVESEVLDALRSAAVIPSAGEVTIFREANNIYRGYNHKEVNHQFLLRPFFGFRVNCRMTHKTSCT